MNKIDLVLHPNEFTSFKSNYLESLFGEYFQFLTFDKTKKYNSRTLFVTNLFGDKAWAKEIKSNGYKVAVDNLWEKPVPTEFYSIQNPNWFWYNESLWYKSLGYDLYIPQLEFTYTAFMSINAQRHWRTNLVKVLGARLNKFLWSYDNQSLLGDIDKNNLLWQRYFNPTWYNSTEFSFVVESNLVEKEFVTEKTFKAIAFSHPFVVYGPIGVLDLLHRNGFETFGEIFDESYDNDTSSSNRLTKLLANVDNYVTRTVTTEQKLKHNRNLFFDSNLVTKKITKEIILPLIEYVESQ